MSETCFASTWIQPGDLITAVDGQTSPAVRHHLAECSHCAGLVEEMAMLQRLLVAALFRHTCPSSEQLVAYLHHDLTDDEGQALTRHVSECPHCARELSEILVSRSMVPFRPKVKSGPPYCG
jgi:anti-sigma factor RsiW